MRDYLNFLIQGLGFANFEEFKLSAFGFMLSTKVLKAVGAAAFVATLVQDLFGFPWQFLVAYVILVIFEWFTGVKASLRVGEKHESRKLGRMLFKIFVYIIIVYMLNAFKQHIEFPVLLGYEIDPFNWLYWAAIFVIIWQLFVSVLENLEKLNFPFASKLKKIIDERFYKNKDMIR